MKFRRNLPQLLPIFVVLTLPGQSVLADGHINTILEPGLYSEQDFFVGSPFQMNINPTEAIFLESTVSPEVTEEYQNNFHFAGVLLDRLIGETEMVTCFTQCVTTGGMPICFTHCGDGALLE